MFLVKKLDVNEEVLNKLEMYNMLAGAHKHVLLSVLNSKNDIDIDEKRFDKYVNEYIEAYINYNVYFNEIVSTNTPSNFMVNSDNTKVYIMFKDSTIHIDTDDADIINCLIDYGFNKSMEVAAWI